ncbi:MAG TPA: D-2-hydroxyacid dehydrogenase [Pyrinomonadaceae bacterium]|nr:D-2-hydroxyacid dehydrogenase [Pyrinomonadaceae bacterium]
MWRLVSIGLPSPSLNPSYLAIMQRIVFLDRSTLIANLRRPDFEHEWTEYDVTAPAQVVERLKEATIAITNKIPLRADSLSELPGLKFIAVAATGVDIVDLDYCRRRSLPVSNVRNYARNSVPEHVFMLILALRRNLLSYREDLERGLWQQASGFCLLTHTIRDLQASTLGIIGYGALGRAVEKLALAFGMRVLISEHKSAQTVRVGRTSFEEVLRTSDIITLHCPLNDETRGLIDHEELEMMRRDAILINTARGGLVDENSLIEALRSGSIAGAGFDVLTREPPREGNPLLELHLPNFILTPHIAWASREAMQTLADQLVENLEAFASGEPRNLVT